MTTQQEKTAPVVPQWALDAATTRMKREEQIFVQAGFHYEYTEHDALLEASHIFSHYRATGMDNTHAALSERVRELEEALFKATKSMEQAETSLRVIEGRDRGTQDDDTVRELFSSSATEAGDAAQDIGNSIYEARQTLAAQRSEP